MSEDTDAMSEHVRPAEIAAAKAYEEFFVPALFGSWASRVAALAQLQTGQHVLDVACGTGVLARETASRVGRTGSVAGVDPSAGMLAVARELAPTIEWRRGTAEALPYPDERFDAVVSQFGLMFFGDRSRALHEMCRVLKAGGRLVVAVRGSLDRAPAYAAEVALLERVVGTQAAEALRAPFVLGDADELRRLIASAGIRETTITTEVGVARFSSIRFMVEADLRGWLPVMGVNLSEEQIQHTLQEAEHALGSYVTPSGKMVFDLAAHLVSGTKSSGG